MMSDVFVVGYMMLGGRSLPKTPILHLKGNQRWHQDDVWQGPELSCFPWEFTCFHHDIDASEIR